MRMMDANKRCLWLSKPTLTEVEDDEGNGTREYVSTWSSPTSFMANASTPTGDSSMSPFGTQVSYDVSVVMDDNELGISEGCAVWLDQEPSLADDGQPVMSDAYTVVRVARSLSSWLFALKSREGS